MRRAHQDGAVLPAFDHHIGRPELHRPQRRSNCSGSVYFDGRSHGLVRMTFGPRFSRNALSRALASSRPARSPRSEPRWRSRSAGSLWAMRGSTCITAKLVNGALPAIFGEFEALGKTFAVRRPDNARARSPGLPRRESVRPVSIMSIIARDADQRRQPHRAAAADKDAAAAFRQRVESRALRDADMRGGREFEPAADHRAMQHGDDRHLAELDRSKARCQERECSMPASTSRSVSSERSRPALKCSPSPASTTARDVRRAARRRKFRCPRTVVSSSALRFCRSRQRQDRDRAVPLGAQRRRQIGEFGWMWLSFRP